MRLLKRLIHWLTGRARLDNRGLLPYWDGRRTRWGDAFRLWRALYNHKVVDLQKHGAAADRGDEPETSEYLAAICEVFDVGRWNDTARTGLTDWELLALISLLATHLETLKKNSSRGPTLLPPTELVASPGPEPPSQVMSEPSDSGSTPDGLTNAAAT